MVLVEICDNDDVVFCLRELLKMDEAELVCELAEPTVLGISPKGVS